MIANWIIRLQYLGITCIFCSQVLFALHVKGVPFQPYEVNVSIGEQYSDWFLELSNRGEVPVLKNGPLIVATGAQIINYVETNFSGGNVSPLNYLSLNENHIITQLIVSESIKDLLPATADEKNLRQIIQFSRIISRLPIGAISKGAFAHASALRLDPKLPYIQPVREALLSE